MTMCGKRGIWRHHVGRKHFDAAAAVIHSFSLGMSCCQYRVSACQNMQTRNSRGSTSRQLLTYFWRRPSSAPSGVGGSPGPPTSVVPSTTGSVVPSPPSNANNVKEKVPGAQVMGDGAGNDKPNNEGNNNNELDQPENEKVEDEQELENSEGQDPEGSGGGDGEGEEDNSGTGDGSGGDHSGEPEIVLPDPDGGGRFI